MLAIRSRFMVCAVTIVTLLISEVSLSAQVTIRVPADSTTIQGAIEGTDL
jgi:hypothetical protein